MYIEQKRFIIRNWLTQLWTLTNPKICSVSQQAGNPKEPMVWCAFEGSAGWRLRKGQYYSCGVKAGKRWFPSMKDFRQEEFPFTWGRSDFLFYSSYYYHYQSTFVLSSKLFNHSWSWISFFKIPIILPFFNIWNILLFPPLCPHSHEYIYGDILLL